MTLQRFIIERDLPAIGSLEREQLRPALARSKDVMRRLGPDIQWKFRLAGPASSTARSWHAGLMWMRSA
jgi:hypothetical protein